MKNRKLLIATAAVSLVGAAGIGATALADSASTGSSNDGNSGLVQKISDTFHLNKNDVQKVFDDWHS